MKNEILDSPFHEQISDVLNKGETILWSEKPKKKNWVSLFDIIVIIFAISLLIFNQSFSPVADFAFLVGGGFLLLLLSSKARDFLEIKNTFYAITPNRIFFQIKDNREKKIFSIPLSEIEKLTMNDKSIFIKTKNPTSPFSEKHNTPHENFDLKPLPVIENVRDIEEVAQILETSIQNIKSLK